MVFIMGGLYLCSCTQKWEETIFITWETELPRLFGSLDKDVKNIFTPSHLPVDDDCPSR